ncbi:MAG: PAS domain S-box protein [Planctomycetes bacterium]|jgi:PAS domain S-box-containing protein|nr:PAS domain S-box protein [Planctomycetota bacterium]
MREENNDQPVSSRVSLRRDLLSLISVAILYFIAVRLSLSFLRPPEGPAAIWPPAGIPLSALLIARRSLRPYLAGVLTGAGFAAELLAGTPWAVGIVSALAQTGDAVLSTWLLWGVLGAPPAFTRVREVLAFLALAVGLSNGLMSLAATAVSDLLPGTLPPVVSWYRRAAAAGIGNLMVTPFLLSWAAGLKTGWKTGNLRRLWEGVASGVGLALLEFLALRAPAGQEWFPLCLPHLTYPVLLWAAFRFEVRGATTALLILAAVALPFVVAGPVGGFSSAPDWLDDVIVGPSFLAIAAVFGLLVGTTVAEHRQAQREWERLAHAEQATLEATNDAIWILDREDRILRTNRAAARLFHHAGGEMIGHHGCVLVHGTPGPMPGCPLQQARASLRRETAEVPYGDRWLAIVADPILDSDGRYAGAIHIASDISERKRAEEALRERSRYIETILENAPIGFAVNTIHDHKVVFASGKFEEIYGQPRGSLHSVEEFFDKVYRDAAFRVQIRARVLADMATGDPARMCWEDVPITTAAGNERFVTAINIPLPDHNLMVSTVQDVTDRHLAEEALRRNEARLKKTEEIARLGSWELDLGTGIATWSEETYRIFGLSPGEFVPSYQAFLEMVHPADRAAVDAAYSGSLQEGRDQCDLEHRIVCRSTGEVRYVHERYQHVRDAAGRVLRSIGMVHDITEHKQAEAALRESEERFRRIFEEGPIGIATSGADFRFLRANAAFCRLMGRTDSELRELTFRDLTHPEDLPRDIEPIRKLLRGEIPVYRSEKRYVRSGAEVMWGDATITAVRDREGKFQNFLVMVEDVTKRKQAEESLRIYQQQLRVLAAQLSLSEERERRRIATGLHDHACQTLVLSKMKLQQLQRSLPGGGPEQLGDICAALDRTIESVREMTFDLSSPTLYRFGLEAALKELLQDKLKAEHGLHHVFRDDHAPKPLAEDVRVVLFQSVRELLVNVIKHAHAHKVTLDIARLQDSIRITIADDGVGFEAPTMWTAPSRGRGFGLFSIRERLDFIGGTIEVDAQPGRGSRFTLVAPLEMPRQIAGETRDDDQNLAGG